jgi:ribosomal protein L13E
MNLVVAVVFAVSWREYRELPTASVIGFPGFAGSDLGEPFKEDGHPISRTGRERKEVLMAAWDLEKQLAIENGFTVVAEKQDEQSGVRNPDITMTTWQKRDWQQFYELARRPWRRHRPPRPVYPSGLNRVAPAQGFSLSELDDAGVDLDLAERLGLPVDAGRIGVYGPNVSVLRSFIRSSRPL